jgi:hypothetical protein
MTFSDVLTEGSGTSIEMMASSGRPADVSYRLSLDGMGAIRKIDLAARDLELTPVSRLLIP